MRSFAAVAPMVGVLLVGCSLDAIGLVDATGGAGGASATASGSSATTSTGGGGSTSSVGGGGGGGGLGGGGAGGGVTGSTSTGTMGDACTNSCVTANAANCNSLIDNVWRAHDVTAHESK